MFCPMIRGTCKEKYCLWWHADAKGCQIPLYLSGYVPPKTEPQEPAPVPPH